MILSRPARFLIIAMVGPLVCGIGAESAALSIRIDARPDKLQALHSVYLDITVTNKADKTITLLCLPPSEVYKAVITGPEGKEPAMTETGRDILRNILARKGQTPNPQIDMRGYQSVTLLPRQTFNDGFELSDLYEMAAPGVYTVKLRRQLSEELGGGEIESNSVTITVTYNPAVEKYRR